MCSSCSSRAVSAGSAVAAIGGGDNTSNQRRAIDALEHACLPHGDALDRDRHGRDRDCDAEAVSRRLSRRVHAQADGRSGWRQSRRSPHASRRGVRKLSRASYARRDATHRGCRAASAPSRATIEGFLFPATYEFFQQTDLGCSSCTISSMRSARTGSRSTSGYARSKNLTPYDVLIIASMVEKETLSPDERQLVSAVIYNRPHTPACRSGSTPRCATASTFRRPSRSASRSSRATRPTTRESGRDCRRRRSPDPGLASLQAAAHPPKVKYLYFVRKPDKKHHFFTASYQAFQNYANAHGYGGP